MPDPRTLSFAHHHLPLPTPSGTVAEAGGHPVSSKAFAETAERIHGALTMAGRFELAAVPHEPDFFGDAGFPKKTHNLVWETTRTTVRLKWLIPTRRPDLIAGGLPPTWLGKGFQNVCVGYLAESGDPLAENLRAFRGVPLQHRLLLLGPSSPVVGNADELAGIGWVILTGGPEDCPLAEHLGGLCARAGAAFLFHQPAIGSMGPASTAGDAGSLAPCPLHPFGNRIDLSIPTLPGLRQPDTPSRSIPGTTLSLPVPDTCISNTMKETTTTVSESEGSPSGVATGFTDPPPPGSGSGLSVPEDDGGARADFERLDAVIRRGLATFIEVGNALAEIRQRELWRDGGHTSWAEYCVSAGGLTKQHANRLILSANIAGSIIKAETAVEPIGSTPPILPESESQIRPLSRVASPETRLEIWNLAVARSGGKPTAAGVSAAAAELAPLPQGGSPEPPGNRRPSPALSAFTLLRRAFLAGKGREEIGRLMEKLGRLLESA